MILDETFTADWIKNIARQFTKPVDLKLLEKVIRALCLLEQLHLQKLSFIFKGGTSLVLRFDQPRRLSIDIDIVMAERTDKLLSLFDAIVGTGLFIRWSDDSGRKSHQHIPVEHYKFYYNSVIDAQANFGPEPILLDILYTKPDYEVIDEKHLNHPWLQTAEPHSIIHLPDTNCLLGDKLTAFAPNTTGILYSKKRPLEIVKQLFDVAFLFDQMDNLVTTRATFERLARQEIGFRGLDISPDNVLDDVFNTALLIAHRDTKDAQFLFLQDGIKRLNNFIVSDFRIEDAIVAGAKAAYLSSLLRGTKAEVQHYRESGQVTDWQITNPAFNKLNKLKKTSAEAFFYWYHALSG